MLVASAAAADVNTALQRQEQLASTLTLSSALRVCTLPPKTPDFVVAENPEPAATGAGTREVAAAMTALPVELEADSIDSLTGIVYESKSGGQQSTKSAIVDKKNYCNGTRITVRKIAPTYGVEEGPLEQLTDTLAQPASSAAQEALGENGVDDRESTPEVTFRGSSPVVAVANREADSPTLEVGETAMATANIADVMPVSIREAHFLHTLIEETGDVDVASNRTLPYPGAVRTTTEVRMWVSAQLCMVKEESWLRVCLRPFYTFGFFTTCSCAFPQPPNHTRHDIMPETRHKC